MIGRLLILVLIGIGWDANAQSDVLFTQLMSTTSQDNHSKFKVKVDQFLTNEKFKNPNSETHVVRSVFKQTHKTLLKAYKQYAQLDELFESGTYDCLTATSLLSVLYQQLGFEYEIIETNYHIFLLVKTNEGEVLVESTDRYHGLVTDPIEIARRISTYRRNQTVSTKQIGKDYHQFNLNLFQEVQPKQLAGLLYFNQAVVAYNEGNLSDCAVKLDRARKIYESPRTWEFAEILVQSVIESDLDEEQKKDLIRPFLKYTRYSQVMASR